MKHDFDKKVKSNYARKFVMDKVINESMSARLSPIIVIWRSQLHFGLQIFTTTAAAERTIHRSNTKSNFSTTDREEQRESKKDTRRSQTLQCMDMMVMCYITWILEAATLVESL